MNKDKTLIEKSLRSPRQINTNFVYRFICICIRFFQRNPRLRETYTRNVCKYPADALLIFKLFKSPVYSGHYRVNFRTCYGGGSIEMVGQPRHCSFWSIENYRLKIARAGSQGERERERKMLPHTFPTVWQELKPKLQSIKRNSIPTKLHLLSIWK